MKIFTIKPQEQFSIFFDLVICDTRKQMMNTIDKAFKVYKEKNCTDEDTAGMFKPNIQMYEDTAPGRFCSDNIGMVYLSQEDLSLKALVHEIDHLSFCYMATVKRYTGPFDGSFYDENAQEDHAYFLMDAVEAARNIIKKNYPKAKL